MLWPAKLSAIDKVIFKNTVKSQICCRFWDSRIWIWIWIWIWMWMWNLELNVCRQLREGFIHDFLSPFTSFLCSKSDQTNIEKGCIFVFTWTEEPVGITQM